MGNISSNESSSNKDEDSDQKFLSFQPTALFNDTFISSLTNSLPLYGFPDDNKAQKEKSAAPVDNDINQIESNNQQRLQKLMSIFASNTESSSKVEDYDILSFEKNQTQSGFFIMENKRARLLIRMFQAYRNSLLEGKNDSKSSTKINQKYWLNQTNDLAEKLENPLIAANGLSLDMCIAMAKALITQDAMLLVILKSLLQSLSVYTPTKATTTTMTTKQLTTTTLSTTIKNQLQSILTFSQDILSTSTNHDIQQVCVSLQLAIGILLGSVAMVLDSVDTLMNKQLTISGEVSPLLTYCLQYCQPHFSLSFPTEITPEDKFRLSVEGLESHKNAPVFSIACDSQHLFVYDRRSDSLYKIGNGLANKTVPGEVVASKLSLSQAIKQYKKSLVSGGDLTEPEVIPPEPEKAIEDKKSKKKGKKEKKDSSSSASSIDMSMTVIQGKLYLRCDDSSVLSRDEIAIFDGATLECSHILSLASIVNEQSAYNFHLAPVHDFAANGDTDGVFRFNYDLRASSASAGQSDNNSETSKVAICIECKQGYTLVLQKALLNKDIDITAAFATLVHAVTVETVSKVSEDSQKTIWYEADVLPWLCQTFPEHASNLVSLEITGNVIYTPFFNEFQVPLTAYGYDLVLIQKLYTAPTVFAKDGQSSSPYHAQKNVFDYCKAIQFTCVELPAKAATGNSRKIFDIGIMKELQGLWKEYIEHRLREKTQSHQDAQKTVNADQEKEKQEKHWDKSLQKKTKELINRLNNLSTTSATPAPVVEADTVEGATTAGAETQEENSSTAAIKPAANGLKNGEFKISFAIIQGKNIRTERTILSSHDFFNWLLVYSQLHDEMSGNESDDSISGQYHYQMIVLDTLHSNRLHATYQLHSESSSLQMKIKKSTNDISTNDQGPYPLSPTSNLLFNGDELQIVYYEKIKFEDNPNSVLHKLWKYDLCDGSLKKLSATSSPGILDVSKTKVLIESHMHQKLHAAVKLAFSYDYSNGFLWAIDAHTLDISRFSVTSRVPYSPYLFTRDNLTKLDGDSSHISYSPKERLVSSFPWLNEFLHRNNSDQSIWKAQSSDQISLLLCQWLDYYSLPYHPPTISASMEDTAGGGSSDSDGQFAIKCVARCVENASDASGHKIQVFVGNQLITFSNLIESGTSVLTSPSNSMNSVHPTGYHVLVFHPESMQIIARKQFDNEELQLAPDTMVTYLESLPVGTPICMLNVNCIHDHMLPHHYEALTRVGAPNLQNHLDIRSFLLLGRTGLSVGMGEYAVGKFNDTITVQRLFTNNFVPLQLEAKLDTIVKLLSMLSRFYTTVFDSNPHATAMSQFVSLLRLFQCNFYHYLHKQTLSDVIAAFTNTILPPSVTGNVSSMTLFAYFKGFVTNILSNDKLMKNTVFQNIALTVYITAFDVLTLNSVKEKLTLLQYYIEEYENHRATDTQLMILEVVLRRLSTWKSLITWENNVAGVDDLLDLSAIHHMVGLCQRIVLQENDHLMKLLQKRLPPVQDVEGSNISLDGLNIITMNSMYSTAVSVLLSLLNVYMTCDIELLNMQYSPNVETPLISNKKSTHTNSPSGYPTMLASICSLCSKVLTSLMPYLHETVLSATGDKQSILLRHLFTFLSDSPIGTILPQITLATNQIVRSYGYPFIKSSMDSCLSLIDSLDGCISSLNGFLSLLPSEYAEYSDSLVASLTEERVYESPHNYLSNMNEYTAIRFPGALHVTISFDQQCKTENGCDYIQFLDINTKQSLHPQIEKLTGRDGNENWPGTGGRPPLVLEHSEFYLYFHSDGSVEDWGYKFTAVATFPAKTNSSYRYNWCQRLVFQLVSCLSSLGSSLMIGPSFDLALEGANAVGPSANAALSACQALAIKPEMFQSYESLSVAQLNGTTSEQGVLNPNNWSSLANTFSVEERQFIQGFFLLQSGSDVESVQLAEKFVKKMKHHVLEDQGKLGWINQAVYCTGIASLVEYHLVKDALDVAKGSIKNPSQMLIKIWKQIQVIRSQFKVPNNGATTTPADDEQGMSFAASIVSRAKFLVLGFAANYPSLTADVVAQPSHDSGTTNASPYRIPTLQRNSTPLEEDDIIVSLSDTPHKSELDKSNISQEDDLLGGPLREGDDLDTSLSPMNRSLMLRRQISDDTQNTVKMWDSLVNKMDRAIIQRIKSTFIRTPSASKVPSKSQTNDELSSCKRVIDFVHNTMLSLDELQSLNRLQNKRCIARAKGYDVFSRLLSSTSGTASPFTVYINHIAYLKALNQIKESFTNLGPVVQASGTTASSMNAFGLHYYHGLDGCSQEQMMILYDCIASFFKRTVLLLSVYFTQYLSFVAGNLASNMSEEKKKSVSKDSVDLYEKAILVCLRSCCLDYGNNDEQLITDSGLLSLLQTILSTPVPTAATALNDNDDETAPSSTGLGNIKAVASAVLEILVGRFLQSSSAPSTVVPANSSVSSTATAAAEIVEPSSVAPTLISQLLGTLTSLLSQFIQQNPILSTILPSSPSPMSVPVLPLTPHTSSYVLPHSDIPLSHSIAFAITRLPSTILDGNRKSVREHLRVWVMKCDDLEMTTNTEKKISLTNKYGITGEIIEIQEENKKLKIRWKSSLREQTYPYSWDEKTATLKIGKDDDRKKEKFVLIDPLIGGYIFSKGSYGINFVDPETMTSDSVKTPTITHLSAQLLPDATLLVAYQLNTMQDSGIFLKTQGKLPSLEASFVVISCDPTGRVNVFVNGVVEATNQLPMPKDWAEVHGAIESNHPIQDQLSFDKLVVIPKASNMSTLGISFDSQSDFGVPIVGNVQISSCNDGTSASSAHLITFPQLVDNVAVVPGVNTEPLWVCPRDLIKSTAGDTHLYVQYMKADPVEVAERSTEENTPPPPSNNNWGFKMTLHKLSQYYSGEANATTILPLYLGGTPNYLKHLIGSENRAMPGILHHFEVTGKVLTTSEMQTLKKFCESDSNSINWQSYSEIPVLNILAILRKAVDFSSNETDNNVAQASLKQYFVSSGLVPIVFQLMHLKNYSTASICAAYHIASLIFPLLDFEYVESIAQSSGILHSTVDDKIFNSFLEMLMYTVGESLNHWPQQFSKSQMYASMKLLSASYAALKPAVEMQAIAESKLKLLHAFAAAKEGSVWHKQMVTLLEQSLMASVSVIDSLSKITKEAFAEVFDPQSYASNKNNAPKSYPYRDGNSALEVLQQGNYLYFLIAFFGGNKSVPTIGNQAYYRDENNSSNMAEIVTILGPAATPQFDRKEQKEEAKKWEKLVHFGDATAIVFPMQSQVMVVPTHSLTPVTANKAIAAQLMDFFGKNMSHELLISFWQILSGISTTDTRPQPTVKENLEEVILHFESAHPYADNTNTYEEITIPGAENLEVIFDAQSRTEPRHDFVCFYKDSSHTGMFGEKYSGRDGEQNFPGSEGRASLIVPSSTCILHFHSDGSNNDWGYKFSVKGMKKDLSIPPPLPTIPSFSMLVDLKMMGLKALSQLMKNSDWLITKMLPTLPNFLSSSLIPKPSTMIMQAEEMMETELMYESSHPYEDSLDVYTPILVPNATRLTISFDPQSRTEHNCDYVIFYTDSSHNTKVPDSETYTGGKDGSSSNWPGTQNRPPLVIEGNSFVLYFHSDSSVNDWGYRFYITAEVTGPPKQVAKVRGKNMSTVQAERSCATLAHYLQDGIGTMPTSVYSKLVQFPLKSTNDSTQERILPGFWMETKTEKPSKIRSTIAESKEEDEENIIESKEEDGEEEKSADKVGEITDHDKAEEKQSPTTALPAYVIPKQLNPPNNDKLCVLIEKLSVYEEASKESAVLKELTQNSKAKILEDAGDWIKIEFDDTITVPAEITNSTESAASTPANESETVTSTAPTEESNNQTPATTTKVIQKAGWIVRRNQDTLHIELLRETLFVQDIAVDKNAASKNKSSKISSSDSSKSSDEKEKKTNPMYGVVDNLSSSTANGKSGTKGFVSSHSLLLRDFDTIEQAITEYAMIAAIGYAQECTATMFQHWPMSPSDTSALLSSSTMYTELMFYLNTCILNLYDEDSGMNKEESLSRAKSIMSLLTVTENSTSSTASKNDDEHILSRRTVALARSILSSTLSTLAGGSATSSPASYGETLVPSTVQHLLTPVRRGFVKSIESKHPYEHNLNEDYVISFPGAKRIEIAFSMESTTETNYDYITIYDTKKENKLYPEKIHGYKSASSRHWPGVNVPKIELKNVDSCIINFTTDGGTNDWGFAAQVVGIMEESSEEEVEAYAKLLNSSAESSTIPLSTTFAIWMIHYLSNSSTSFSKSMKSTFFTIEMFRLLIKYFIQFSNKPEFELKSELLEIFVVFVQELTALYMTSSTGSCSTSETQQFELQEIVLEFSQLEKTLMAFGFDLYKLDTNDGKNLQGASTTLQATVQLLITIDNAINTLSTHLQKDLFCLEDIVGPALSIQELPKNPCSSTVDAVQGSWRTYVESTISHPPTATIIGWDIILEKIHSEMPIIGITLSREQTGNAPLGQNAEYFELGFREHTLYFKGQHTIEYNLDGKPWKEGDVLSIIYDKIIGMVTFAVNRAVVMPAIGPRRLQPAIEMPFINRSDVHLAVSLANPQQDKVKVLTKKVVNRKTTSTTISFEWLEATKQVDSILQSIQSQTIPPFIIMNKFVPLCHKQSVVDVNMNASIISSLFPSFENTVEAGESGEGVAETEADVHNPEPIIVEEVIHIPATKSLHFIFKDLQLADKDVVELIDKEGNVKLRLTQITNLKSSIHNLDAYIQKVTVSNLDPRNNRLNPRPLFKNLEIGDRVVRGPDWAYGTEDGGRGSLGTVTKLSDWKSLKNAAVVVKWDGQDGEKTYRYTSSTTAKHEVMFANIAYLSATSAGSIVTKLDQNACYVASGMDYLTLKLTFTALPKGSLMERKFHCVIIPSFSIHHCLTHSQFDRLKSQFHKLYVPKTRNALVALVKHINQMAKSKNWKRDDILTKSYSEFTPSSDALSRSVLLKELVDAETVEFDEDIGLFSNDMKLSENDNKPTEQSTANTSATSATNDSTDENRRRTSRSRSRSQTPPIRSRSNSEESTGSANSLLRDLRAGGADEETINALLGERRRERRANRQTREQENNRASRSVSRSPSASASESEDENEEEEESVRGSVNSRHSFASHHSDSSHSESDDEEENNDGSEESDEGFGLFGSAENSESERSDDDDEDHEDEEEGSHRSGSNHYSASLRSSSSHDGVSRSGSETPSRSSSRSRRSDGEEEEENSGEREGGRRRERGPSSVLQRLISRRRQPSATAGNENSAGGNDTAGGNPLAVCGKCKKRMRKHVAGTWSNGWICDWPQHEGPNRFRSSDCVYGCESVVQCNWGICEGCWNRISLDSLEQYTNKVLANTKSNRPIEAIFSMLQFLNINLIKALPFIDIRKGQNFSGTLAFYVSTYRELIFETVKSSPFDQALQTTASTGGVFDLPLSRFKARRFAAEGKVDAEGRWTVYSQAFRVIHVLPPSQLRRDNKLYTTKFIGEHAQDAGGPYRESFDIYCQELQSGLLPLFIRTPNYNDEVGYNREKWILNPAATTTTQLEMFAFLGKLMGVAIRSKEYLALNIPSIIWKLIVQDTPTMEDIEGIEFNLAKSIQCFRTIDSMGVTEETFQDTFFQTFTTTSSAGQTIELIPGGKEKHVTFQNRHEYCDLVIQYRLHEFDKQANAIREGLSTIVPISLLSLYNWEQLEEMVCGCAEIDIKLLESITEYSSCDANDQHIRNFWQVLSEFNNEERSALIRFTWGRSRLPLTAEGFAQRFKIQSFDRSPPDSYFPIAHTCFFSLELPRYSTVEIMKERLRYAIFNCHAIDADDTSAGSAAAAMLENEE